MMMIRIVCTCTFLVDLVRDIILQYSLLYSHSSANSCSSAVLQSYREPRHWALFPLPSAFEHPSLFIYAGVLFLPYFLSTVGTVGIAAVISGIL